MFKKLNEKKVIRKQGIEGNKTVGHLVHIIKIKSLITRNFVLETQLYM